MQRIIKAKDRIAARYIPEGCTVFREIPGAVVYAGPVQTPLKGERIRAIAYRGTAMKADWSYIFTNKENLNAETERFFEKITAIQKYRSDRIATRASFVPTLKAEDIRARLARRNHRVRTIVTEMPSAWVVA